MRQIYKDIVIGFILASFVYTPGAFAKPRSPRVKAASKKSAKPLYTNLERTIRSNKKGLKISSFVNSAEPMVKNREFRDMKKMFMPFWDKKFDKMVVGKDHFVVGFKGQKIFGRYVDRGPIAFIINGQPLLWKDVLIYGKAKNRLMEIMGVKNSKNRKVSFQEFLMDQIFPKAFGITEQICKDLNKKFIKEGPDGKATCECSEGFVFKYGSGCQIDPNAPKPPPLKSCDAQPGTVLNEAQTECVCPDGRVWNETERCDGGADPIVGGGTTTPEPAEKKKSWLPWILIGAALLLVLFLIFKKKKKKDPVTPEPPVDPEPPVEPEPPLPGWTPEPEGQCPTPGARGITEADLPPECRKSTCSDTNSCTSTDGGVIY